MKKRTAAFLKRAAAFALALIMGISLLPGPAQAAESDFEYDGKTYYAVGNDAIQNIMMSKSPGDSNSLAEYWRAVAALAYYSKFVDPDSDSTISNRYMKINDDDAWMLLGGKGLMLYDSAHATLNGEKVNYAASIGNAYTVMTDEIMAVYKKLGGSRDDKEKIVATELKGFSDNTDGPAAYSWSGAFNRSSPTGHYVVTGIIFSNFRATPILGQNSNPKISMDTDSSSSTISSGVDNRSTSDASISQTLATSVTNTVSNSVEKSESYSFSESLEISSTFSAGLAGLAEVSVSHTLGFSAEQAFSTAWSESHELSETTSSEASVSLTLPPHTQTILRQSKGTTQYTMTYDCPIAITYDVDILVFELDPTKSDTSPLVERLVSFHSGQGAQADFAGRFIKGAAGDTDLIDWANGIDRLYDNMVYQRDNYPANTEKGDSAADYDHIISLVWESWSTAWNNTDQIIYQHMAKCVPFLMEGGSMTLKSEGYTSEIVGIAPLFPLTKVAASPAVYEYNLTSGDYLYMDAISLAGYDSDNVPFYGFNADKGGWVLLDGSGREIGGNACDTAALVTDPVSGYTTLQAGTEPGKVYVKYKVTPGVYDNTDTGLDCNENELDTVVILVNVSETPFNGELTLAEGPYDAYVGDPAVNLNELIPATCYDADQRETVIPLCWEVQELEGYNLDPNTGAITFDTAGTYHVRTWYDSDKVYYSNWVEVEANPARALNTLILPEGTITSGLYTGSWYTLSLALFADHASALDQYGCDMALPSDLYWACSDSAVTFNGNNAVIPAPGTYSFWLESPSGISSGTVEYSLCGVTDMAAAPAELPSNGGTVAVSAGVYAPDEELPTVYVGAFRNGAAADTCVLDDTGNAVLALPVNMSSSPEEYVVRFSYDASSWYELPGAPVVTVANSGIAIGQEDDGGYVLADAGEGGSVRCSTGTTAALGETLTFTAVPDPGFRVLQWSINGEPATDEKGALITDKEFDVTLFGGPVILLVEFEPDVSMSFYSASLSLTDAIDINFYTLFAVNDGTAFTPGILFSREEQEELTHASADLVITEGQEGCTQQDKYFRFTYSGLAAKNMNDAIYARLFLTLENGTVFYGPVQKYSVADYAVSVFAHSSDKLLKRTVVDMLAYGSMAQKYFDYRADEPADACLTDAQKKLGTTADAKLTTGPVFTDDDLSDPDSVGFRSASLTLENRVEVNYYGDVKGSRTPKQVDLLVWKSWQEGDEFSAATAQETLPMTASSGIWKGTLKGIPAKEMRADCLARIHVVYGDGSEAYSSILQYSPAAYVYQVRRSAVNADLTDVAEAMIRYGDSAAAYFKKAGR